MKGLDTPVLLDLLRGGSNARRLLKKIGSEEMATTELNLWELTQLACSDRTPGREARIAALERLRRRLTVLPIDVLALGAATRRSVRATGPPSTEDLMIGSLEAHGGTEWITDRA
ncbi:MAG: PIN domain-containing protein, partial [Thermoplasmata archaeon]